MRIARLALKDYGKFSEAALSFSKVEGGDLQFIVGPNEAGKSTVRSAILEFLFGIEKFSPYAYWKSPDMAVRALIEAPGGPFEFRRSKTRSLKDSLADAAGTKLDPGVIARLMDNADKPFYERMFGLDHPGLVKGAKDMLNSAGDVGQMLFQAATGVNGLHKLRERLEREAGELWTGRQNMSCAFYVAQKRFNEANTTLKQVMVSASVWQKQKRALDGAAAALSAAQGGFVAADREHQRLERVRRVEPFLRDHEEATALLATLGAPPLLPTTARATLDEASVAMAREQDRIDHKKQQLTEDSAEAAAIPVNAAVMERKAEIDSLASRQQTYLDAVRDRPGLVARRNENTDKVRQLAAQLGWPETDLAAIAARVPAKVERTTLVTLAQSQPALLATAAQAQDKLDEATEGIGALERRIREEGAHTPHAGLDAAARAATALNLPVRGPVVKSKLNTANAKLKLAFDVLAPWKGTEAELRAMALPTQTELQDFTDRRAKLLSRREQLQQTHDAKSIEAPKAKAALDAFSRQHQVVTPEVLNQHRRSRDELWSKVRQGADVSEIGDQYEDRVRAADAKADQRFDGAAMIERHATLVAAHEALAAEVEALAKQIAAVNGEIETLQGEWRDRTKGVGLALTQPELANWSELRDAALAAADAVTDAKSACDALTREAIEVEGALREALADAGEALPAGAGAAALATLAETVISARAKAATRVAEWNEQLRIARNGLPALQRKQREAADALDKWNTAWTAKLAKAGLAADLPPAAIGSAVETLADIEEACLDVRENTGPRVLQMEQEIASFSSRAKALAEACAPAMADDAPEKIVPWLRDLLREAESHSKRFDLLRGTIAKTREALDVAVAAKGKAESALAPLCEVANVPAHDVVALTEAIAAAEQYRGVQARIDKAATAARLSGDNRPLAELMAERVATDVTVIEELLLTARTARESARKAYDEAIVAHTQAKDAFDKIAGQDDAARAESQRRDALLEMTEAVEEYVKITVGAKLVKWAVDRYSEEKQQPLLKRASGLFSGLTGGRFNKLTVNFDVEPPELVAHRPDGSQPVGIAALSRGTEDQLYLALRLAALELHLASGTPLPLILDDIFINWSDERTAAGFKVLADLSKRTQVIVLSHHEHLVEVAKGAVGARINVIPLAA